jgi:cytidine deaminase
VEVTPLSEDEKDFARLVDAARAATRQAYCPYSKFPVGAAVLADDGSIFSACNVENASYSLTVCAERNAIFHAVAAGRTDVRFMVVYTPTATPTAPCGACRQVLNEFSPDARVRCVCDGPGTIELAVSDLLPKAFGPLNLLG